MPWSHERLVRWMRARFNGQVKIIHDNRGRYRYRCEACGLRLDLEQSSGMAQHVENEHPEIWQEGEA